MGIKRQAAVPLSALKKGQGGSIVGLKPFRKADLQKFLTLGLLPGEKIIVLHHQPLHVVRVGYSQIALDREGARAVYILAE